MSNRAGGGDDSPSSTASPDDKDQEGGEVDKNPSETISDTIPPPFSKTVDEIDVCPLATDRITNFETEPNRTGSETKIRFTEPNRIRIFC